jgi:hypothetical protein
MKAKIIAHQVDNDPCIIRPAVKEREWMDATPDKFAYRCLPLNIGNSTGWDIFPPCDFIILWSNDNPLHQRAIHIEYAEDGHNFACSVFGAGIVTFHTGYLFETSENVDLLVTAPPNFPVDFAYGLTGIVETWWLRFTFTMNWKMTKFGHFHWTKDMPLCRIVPIPHNFDLDVSIQNAEDTPDLYKEYREYGDRRTAHNAKLEKAFKTYTDQGDIIISKPSTHWQKNYYRGVNIYGEKQPHHLVKRKFPEFKRKNGKDNTSESD